MEACLRENVQEAKVSLKKELATLREQMEKAKVDVVVEFRASQPFIDVCAIYYSDGFDDFLK